MEVEQTHFTCRGCLQSSSGVHEIFSENNESTSVIIKMLGALSIQITEDDKLPNILCSICFTSLETAYNFVQTFNNSQKVLQQWLDINISGASTPTGTENNGETSGTKNLLKTRDVEDTDYITADEESDLEETDQNLLIEESIKLTREYMLSSKNPFDIDKVAESDTDSIVGEAAKMNDSKQDHESEKPSKNGPLQCPLCPASYHRKYNCFSSHLKRHNQIIPCKFCNLLFEDADVFIEHYRAEHKYQCHICHVFLPRCDAFTRHMQMHDKTLFKFKCPVKNCSKTYSTRNAVKSHFDTMHSENRNFLCNLCGISFKNYDNLRYHTKKHEGPSHLCSICGARFMQAGHLKHHMFRHTGTKPFKCAICQKAFVTRRILRLHVEKEVCLRNKSGKRLKVNISRT